MNKFGYTIAKPRLIDLDKTNNRLFEELIEKVPSLKRCMMCGSCTATCMAANHTDFNFRKCHLLLRRGQWNQIIDELDKCMLCGKCQLVCPRGVNTRAVIKNMRVLLRKTTYERRIVYAFGK